MRYKQLNKQKQATMRLINNVKLTIENQWIEDIVCTVRTFDKFLAWSTEQITCIGMRTRASSTNNSPSTRDTPGIGEVVEPKTYSIFSAVAKPRAPAIKYTGRKKKEVN